LVHVVPGLKFSTYLERPGMVSDQPEPETPIPFR